MKINYQIKMEEIINKNKALGKTPKLLLHSCCAPCSSYVLKYLAEYFEITVFYYNPNISESDEYQKRVKEQKRFIGKLQLDKPISFIEGDYEPKHFFDCVRGYEDLGEGSERCFKCYRLRLEETAKVAKENNYDYFTTTLSISPYKNSQVLNEIGYDLENKYQINYLCADFKKRNGYKISIQLANKYNLYRQDYCGCVYSKQEHEKKVNSR